MSDLDLSKWRISKQVERIGEMNDTLREAHSNTPFIERQIHKLVASFGRLDGYGEPGEIETLRACLRGARCRLDAWTDDPSDPSHLRSALRWIGSARGWAKKLKVDGSPPVSEFIEEHCLGWTDIYDFQEAVCFTLDVEHDTGCACDIAIEQMKSIANDQE